MENLEYYFDEIEYCECVGEFEDEYVYDVEMVDKTHTFIANDTLIHNSTYTRGDVILKSLGIDPFDTSIDIKHLSDILQYIFETKMNTLFSETLENIIVNKRHGENIMKFELEFIGGRGIFIEPKKYITTILMRDGNYVAAKGWLKATGIEIKQAGSSETVHKILKSFINIVFTKWTSFSEKEFFGICSIIRKKANDLEIDKLTKINRLKKFDEYIAYDKNGIPVATKGASAQIKGSIEYNKLIEKNKLNNKYPYLKRGMRCRWYYDKNGIPFSYPEECYPEEILPAMDIDRQLDKLVFAPMKRIIVGLVRESILDQAGKKNINLGLGRKKGSNKRK